MRRRTRTVCSGLRSNYERSALLLLLSLLLSYPARHYSFHHHLFLSPLSPSSPPLLLLPSLLFKSKMVKTTAFAVLSAFALANAAEYTVRAQRSTPCGGRCFVCVFFVLLPSCKLYLLLEHDTRKKLSGRFCEASYVCRSARPKNDKRLKRVDHSSSSSSTPPAL